MSDVRLGPIDVAVRIAAAAAVVVTVILATPTPVAALDGPLQRIVVGLSDSVVRPGAAAAAAADAGGEVVRSVTTRTVAVEVPAPTAEAAAVRLEADPRVAWAEPDVVYRAVAVPDDPCYFDCSGYDQFNLRLVGAESAWNVTRGSPAVLVASLDTGVDASHPDLQGKVVVGPNLSPTAGNNDVNGHGTHVAGIIGARTGNAVGVAGLGWDTQVLSIKVLDDEGAGFGSDIAEGVYRAMESGAKVINLSLAGEVDRALRDAVTSAVRAGVVVVAAAGNEGSSAPTYPAAYDGVLAVGASTGSDRVAGFSNWGTWVDLVGPGELVLSTLPGGYGLETGTSQAAPLVAAGAALMLAVNPGLSGQTVSSLLQSTAAAIPGTGSTVAYGRLDVARAVTSAIGASNGNANAGYRMVASDGGIFSFGNAPFFGSLGNLTLNQPIVGMASTPTGRGYWLVARDGGIFSFGDAGYRGSAAGLGVTNIVGMAATTSGQGYWIVAANGDVFAFGDAPYLGRVGSLNHPVVGVASAPRGDGYWLVARDGGIFSFGSAAFHGSTGNIRLNRPVVGIAPTPLGSGYWLVASDGGIFAFGDARFFGSTGNIVLNRPVVGMAANPTGTGYWLVASDGGIFAFGNAPFAGSTGNIRLNQPVVGMSL